MMSLERMLCKQHCTFVGFHWRAHADASSFTSVMVLHMELKIGLNSNHSRNGRYGTLPTVTAVKLRYNPLTKAHRSIDWNLDLSTPSHRRRCLLVTVAVRSRSRRATGFAVAERLDLLSPSPSAVWLSPLDLVVDVDVASTNRRRLSIESSSSWLSEEVVEMEHELNELRKHISAQGIVVQDLMSGVCRELDEWTGAIGDIQEAEQNLHNCEPEDPLSNKEEDHKRVFLENVDVLLAEHKVEETLEALDAEERSHPELKVSGDTSSSEPSSYKSAFLKRKAMLESKLVEITEQPVVGVLELKKAVSGLIKLGKGALAHQLLLKSYGCRLQKSIEAFLPLCPSYPETYSATLSNLVFSSISLTTKQSNLMFGDNPVYTNRVIQWAEWEIESFVRLVKENAPPSETVNALRAASTCVQASLSHCFVLESQGLKFSKLLLVLLRPYIEEVLELNFRRARRVVLDFTGTDDSLPLSPRSALHLHCLFLQHHLIVFSLTVE
ncbi:hypothetical protein Acr_00g0093730 [Actinidia rufa]|uniref:Exocyst component Exo84 C-terminal domain-containing protein n=1 Tax=Actinidia rufa TaxID=165716 RepID=A0A7J0DY20_9ERIC|nr:hypothetical protein Acr_00g0093730 [Actinidia rufa]